MSIGEFGELSEYLVKILTDMEEDMPGLANFIRQLSEAIKEVTNETYLSRFYGLLCLTPGHWVPYETQPEWWEPRLYTRRN